MEDYSEYCIAMTHTLDALLQSTERHKNYR
jgi:hypothetical protein